MNTLHAGDLKDVGAAILRAQSIEAPAVSPSRAAPTGVRTDNRS